MAEPSDEAFEEEQRREPPRQPGAEAEGIQANPPPARGPRADEDERDDERRPRRRQRARPEDDDALAGIIPYKNGMALAAYYCGVFGLIPCVGLILGPLSIIFGIMGLRKVRDNPQARGTGHAITGIVLGSLEVLGNLVLLALFGFSLRGR